MIELEVDGQKVSVPEGSMVMHAAQTLGVYVPHFCYHKKLSIAANCRMCLVEVEKAPKPLPACATPVTAGMIVHTHSEKAKAAQKSVMEFLLINHPLDCPICDQGGECQLQDLAVGYGGIESRYQEEKRVVFHKNVGPLVSMAEMSRCIHCTRCVRFGQEVAGQMELGMLGRGEHSEISTFVDKSVDSELSGNMIDLCPVGALTSKPFRYSARTWELARRKSVAMHDSLGSNLIVQSKNQQVKRVLPLENEGINECWLSDRDRFSYEGLNSVDRLTKPMIKQNGQWVETDWQNALVVAAEALQAASHAGGANAVAALANANSTTEELYLLNTIWQKLGSDSIDFRLRQSRPFGVQGVPHLGIKIDEIAKQNHILVVGTVLRHEQPLLTSRLRKANQKQLKISRVSPLQDDALLTKSDDLIGADMAVLLSAVAHEFAQQKNLNLPTEIEVVSLTPSQQQVAQNIAGNLIAGGEQAIWLGNIAAQSPIFFNIYRVCTWLAEQSGAKLGFLGESANSAGAYWVGAYREHSDLKAKKAYLLLNVEPELDVADSGQLIQDLQSSDCVVALSAYGSERLLELATVLLPIAPFTETSGTYVNSQGDIQSFQAVVRGLANSRPGWKVLRALANMLGYSEITFQSSEDVLQALKSSKPFYLNNEVMGVEQTTLKPNDDQVNLLTTVAPYGLDAVVRRAESLQATRLAKESLVAQVSADVWDRLKAGDGAQIVLQVGQTQVVVSAQKSVRLAHNTIWLQSGTAMGSALPAFAFVQVALA